MLHTLYTCVCSRDLRTRSPAPRAHVRLRLLRLQTAVHRRRHAGARAQPALHAAAGQLLRDQHQAHTAGSSSTRAMQAAEEEVVELEAAALAGHPS